MGQRLQLRSNELFVEADRTKAGRRFLVGLRQSLSCFKGRHIIEIVQRRPAQTAKYQIFAKA